MACSAEYKNFGKDDITLLVDMYPSEAPTRENILKHMEKLVADAQPGDSLFLSCETVVFFVDLNGALIDSICT